MTETVDTTLITPLAAYLDLRTRGRAAFLLESVDRGRLGRYSLVGCGDRLVSFEEAERSAEPVVGYLAYDHVAKLEPTVPLPDAGAGPAGEPVRGRRRAAPLRPPARRRGGACGPADLQLADRVPTSRTRARYRHETQRFPDAETYMRGVERCKEHIREGDAFQIVLSQRAEKRTTSGRSRSTARCGA